MTKSQIAKLDLDAAMAEFEFIPQPIRSFWASTTALRDHVAKEMGKFLACIQDSPGNPLHLQNSLHKPFTEARCRTELATLKTHADFLAGTAEFIEADEQVAPIVAKIHALQADLASAVDTENRAEANRLEQLEAAKAAAIAEVESRFAKQEPAPQEPAKPFRGRVKPMIASEAEGIEAEEPSFA